MSVIITSHLKMPPMRSAVAGTISSLDGWPRALDVLALARAKCVRIDEAKSLVEMDWKLNHEKWMTTGVQL